MYFSILRFFFFSKRRQRDFLLNSRINMYFFDYDQVYLSTSFSMNFNHQSPIMLKAAIFAVLVTLILSCNLIENTKELIDQAPTLIRQVPNGQKLLIGDPTNPQGDYLYIANLKGTPREMGKALGQLYAQQIHNTLDLFYGYYMGQLEQILQKKLPTFLAAKLTGGVESLLKRILDLNIRITKRYTNKRYFQEIKGIAEGAAGKVKEKDVLRLNLFPELIKAACTVAGVWNEATQNGQTLHVRALDWDYKNPISKYPLAIIYHPSDPKLHVHANFAWAGFIGSLTGISDKISLGEKVWIPPQGSVKTTRYGNPWTYVFRDILYEAHDLKSAIEILTNTHRTCAIHIGVASAADHSFRMFEYAEKVLNNYDDSNYTHYGANHPKKQGLAYFDKHVQPSGDTCVGQVLAGKLYGHWNAENLYRAIGLSHQTGDTQLAVFDLENQLAYVSYSSADGNTQAFLRSPIKVNLGVLFKPF